MQQGSPPATIGDRVRQARQQRGLTQQELADLAAMRRGTVASIERGRLIPRDHTTQRLATALDVSPQWLLRDEEGDRQAP